MRRTIELRTVLLVVLVAIGGGVTSRVLAAAQPTASGDVLGALLTEVRGLRAAIEQMTSASARIQLSVARLQIEEQRINDGGKRLQYLRQRLGDARRKVRDNEDQVARVDNELRGGRLSEESRQEFTTGLAALKRDAVSLKATVSDLSAEEAQLTQDMAAEQARWIEVSRRLDELDASMAIRK